jgi:dimethylamine/trimethylamine dehydrogenase
MATQRNAALRAQSANGCIWRKSLSIADQFLAKRIENGHIDDIRECIGCNVCVTGDYTMTPIRRTQNPTMGEEWRKGWHPEAMPPRSGEDSFLIVGAGPSGLECARLLGRRGYSVHVAEAGEQLGGRLRGRH